MKIILIIQPSGTFGNYAKTMIAMANAYKKIITFQMNKYIGKNELEKALKLISEKTNIPIHILKKRDRKRHIIEARFLYFRYAKGLKDNYSLDSIGELVGKSHSDVIYGIKQTYLVRELRDKWDKYFNHSESNENKISEVIKKETNRNKCVKPELEGVTFLPYSGYREHQR